MEEIVPRSPYYPVSWKGSLPREKTMASTDSEKEEFNFEMKVEYW